MKLILRKRRIIRLSASSAAKKAKIAAYAPSRMLAASAVASASVPSKMPDAIITGIDISIEILVPSSRV